jgi:peptidyl-prolyl cis-trans isomerase B (cyclophilin B)
VREGYDKGTVIHRVENYVVQGGGFIIKNYQYTQKAATHDPIVGEFTNNGYKNPLSHTAGTISMARTTDPNSATSQFFFCPVDYTAWDGSYAAFGHVVDDASLAAIVRLSKVEAQNSYPLTPIILNSVDILQ